MVKKTKILELFHKGFSSAEISKQLRCSKSTVSYHCSKFINKVDKYTPELLKIYQDAYDQGLSFKGVADKFKVSRQLLGKKLKARKLTKLQIKQKADKRKKGYRLKVKEQCVEYKGGKCCKCGYNKCLAALEFHHIDPNKKDYTISGGTKSFQNLKSELDKCILVCKNCHAEIHFQIINNDL